MATKYPSQAKYDRANTRNYSLKFNKKTDADIYEKLEQQTNVTGYIKRLIRADIARQDKVMHTVANDSQIGYDSLVRMIGERMAQPEPYASQVIGKVNGYLPGSYEWHPADSELQADVNESEEFTIAELVDLIKFVIAHL